MPAPGRRGPAAAVCAAVLTAVAYASVPAVAHAADPTGPPPEAVAEQTVSVPVGAEPDGSAVTLDGSVFTPSSSGPVTSPLATTSS